MNHRVRAAIVVVIGLLGWTAVGGPWAASSGLGAPTGHAVAAQLVNASTVTVPRDQWRVKLDTGRDYIVKLSGGKARGHVMIDGGRNVLIDGGHIVMRRGGSDIQRRALYIKGARGVVEVRNLLIEGKNHTAFDAIAINAPAAEVQLKNVRVTGVYGRVSGFHGDIIQPFGGVKRLVVDGLTGQSSYQGLYLVGTSGRIGAVVLRRVNLSYLSNKTDKTTFLLWFEGCRAYPVTLDRVYIQPRRGQSVARESVRPSVSSTDCTARRIGNQVTWPGLISGGVTEGRPPGGAFVPRSAVD